METRNLIEYAIEKEVMSRRMYENAAERTENDEARMMFHQLAGFEADHVKIFTQAMDSEIQRLGFDVPGFLSECETKAFQLSEDFDQQALDDAPMEKILDEAGKFEKSMSEFYARIAETSGNPTIVAMGKRLAGEERDHYEYVTRLAGTLGLSMDTQEEEFHAH